MSPVYIKTRAVKSGKRYLVYWRRGGRAFKEEYGGSFKTKKEAVTRRDLIAGELAAGRDPHIVLEQLRIPPQPAPGLLARWDQFIASRSDVGEKARRGYRNARDRWTPILGETRDPDSITVDDIIDGVALLADDLAPDSVRMYASGLAQVLDFCDRDPNPVRSKKVRLPAPSRAEKELPGNETWFAIRDHAKKRSRLALRLEEACAFRVSETADLEYGDIDFIEQMIRVRREGTKTAAGRRWVPVPDELLDEIDDLVPVEDRGAHRRVLGLTSGRIYTDLVNACVAAGAPAYGTHALRHRRISLWLRHGIDPVQVARWAGHSKPSESLNTYGHVVIDPAGDEWRRFWLAAYAAGRSPGAAPVRHEESE